MTEIKANIIQNNYTLMSFCRVSIENWKAYTRFRKGSVNLTFCHDPVTPQNNRGPTKLILPFKTGQTIKKNWQIYPTILFFVEKQVRNKLDADLSEDNGLKLEIPEIEVKRETQKYKRGKSDVSPFSTPSITRAEINYVYVSKKKALPRSLFNFIAFIRFNKSVRINYLRLS